MTFIENMIYLIKVAGHLSNLLPESRIRNLLRVLDDRPIYIMRSICVYSFALAGFQPPPTHAERASLPTVVMRHLETCSLESALYVETFVCF